jgi:hypothetical protein
LEVTVKTDLTPERNHMNTNLSSGLRSALGRRPGRAIGALAIAAGALVVAAGPATAAPVGPQSCNPTTGSNSCISINLEGDWHVHVGLDVNMPQQYAQEIINCGNPFSAEIWGDDGGGSSDDYRTWMPVSPGWPAAGPTGLGVEFDKFVDWRVLNEDDGTDEIYVKIFLYDCHTGATRTFRTNNIVHNF